MSGRVCLPLTTVVDGRTWQLHQVLFDTADGTFSTYIYALNDEHAVAIIEELKGSAQWGGQIVHTEPSP